MNEYNYRCLINWMCEEYKVTEPAKMLIAHMLCLRPNREYLLDKYPTIERDIQQCVKILELCPQFRDRLNEMRAYSPYWEALIQEWEWLSILSKQERWVELNDFITKTNNETLMSSGAKDDLPK